MEEASERNSDSNLFVSVPVQSGRRTGNQQERRDKGGYAVGCPSEDRRKVTWFTLGGLRTDWTGGKPHSCSGPSEMGVEKQNGMCRVW